MYTLLQSLLQQVLAGHLVRDRHQQLGLGGHGRTQRLLGQGVARPAATGNLEEERPQETDEAWDHRVMEQDGEMSALRGDRRTGQQLLTPFMTSQDSIILARSAAS